MTCGQAMGGGRCRPGELPCVLGREAPREGLARWSRAASCLVPPVGGAEDGPRLLRVSASPASPTETSGGAGPAPLLNQNCLLTNLGSHCF